MLEACHKLRGVVTPPPDSVQSSGGLPTKMSRLVSGGQGYVPIPNASKLTRWAISVPWVTPRRQAAGQSTCGARQRAALPLHTGRRVGL